MEFIHAARPSPIAGTWYTDDLDRLQTEVDGYINQAVISEDEFKGHPLGIVVPHAGHIYSGKTAGYAYHVIRGLKPDVVVVLSPFHQYHPADLLTTAYDAYATPLGQIPVDTALLGKLSDALSAEGIPITQIERDPEHSLEIQLPFLQRALEPGFKLLPLMVRTRDAKKLKLIAEKLADLLGDTSHLIVASTDLSHFHAEQIAHRMDAEMLRRIKAMDAHGVLEAEREGVASACGASSVALLFYTLGRQKNPSAYVLNYSTSAETTGDTQSVVGYGSAVIFD